MLNHWSKAPGRSPRRRKSGDRSLMHNRLRSEGNGGDIMLFRKFLRVLSDRVLAIRISPAILVCLFALAAHAASIRGFVADASGARVTGATVNLITNGQVVGTTVSGVDGSFELSTGLRGRFYLVVSAAKFRQLETPGFYAGQLDSIERNIVL